MTSKKYLEIEKMTKKANIYLASPVFREMADNGKISVGLRNEIKKYYNELKDIADVSESEQRFPDADTIQESVEQCRADFIGCHLSHEINKATLLQPWVKGVATSTAGYNHIADVDGVLITNTPSVLDKATADYTIAAILSNLRNISALHNHVWDGKWEKGQKWDLDNNLGNSIDNLTVGIVGMGEIGKEVVRRLAPWGVRIIYFSRTRKHAFENEYSGLEYVENLEILFESADIVSLHVLLNESTKHLVDEALLSKMKPGSLLVNTARGEVVDFEALVRLLKSGNIHINLAFDVFETEPLPDRILNEFHEILRQKPDLRFTMLPHNASADADTRARMAIMMLKDLISMVCSTCTEDIQSLNLIPQQRQMNSQQIVSGKMKEYWAKS